MGRRSFLAVAGWLATAVVATLIGVAAIRLVGESLTGTPGGVRSQEEVARALAEPMPGAALPTSSAPAGATTSSPAAASATPSPGAGARRGFATTGGTAIAECRLGGVFLMSWTAAPGYRVDDVDRGPDDDVEVSFVGPGGEYELSLRCVGGQPVAVPDDDD
ncbi:hypothetical protein GA0070616_3773 [Micromonospora nigra]|uniref:Septum formation initiator n=1 Tax=Micromonospora nigra TaxID=145857 RepID=A0A1C6SHD6_9ACTN|nr:septum formation initiator [Micromonospora nigra]SCL28853.1 hypothetical protein GA0070616_3773 [Micromonospora nigra]